MSSSKRATAMKMHASALLHLESDARKLRGIIFDCDGVLFDSKEANTAYYNHIRFAVRLPPMTEEEAAYSHMVSTDEAIESMIPPNLLEQAKLVRSRVKYRDTFMGMMQPAPHVYSCLKELKESGLRLALCTNRSDSVHEVLRHFEMDHFFSPVMTITNALPKPSPEGLLEVTKTWDVPAGSVAFIGDSLVDQQAAAAADVQFWSYANPQLSAEMHITSFKELGEIVHLMLMHE